MLQVFLDLFGSGDVEEMSNNKLARFFSAEMVVSMLTTAFVVGMTWSSLTKDVSATDAKVERVEEKHLRLDSSVRSIQVDMAVVKANQEHIKRTFNEKLTEQATELREQSRDIKRILELLRDEGEKHGTANH